MRLAAGFSLEANIRLFMRRGKFILSLLLTFALGYLLIFPVGSLPFSLGDFFNPYRGFWQNAVSMEQLIHLPSRMAQLNQPVGVTYNERGVPAIFAENVEDAYFMQGYVTARDRLWQMDFQTYAAAGRLTEIMPSSLREALLQHDREMRRKGLPYAAKKSLAAHMEHSTTRKVLAAYTAGVNAYIRSLSPGEYPLEYKILGYAPEKWSPYKSCLLLKYMANMLAGNVRDISHTKNLRVWGKALFDTLYQESIPVMDPIIPSSSPLPDSILPVPTAPLHTLDTSLLAGNFLPVTQGNIGSNNWAVSGTRTVSGAPLLANDPHLGLSLPSIWYEIQLCINKEPVYGVAIPGAPGITIGFNEHIAWGLTNAGRDILDFYTLSVRDSTFDAYWMNGKWNPMQIKVDTFLFKGGGMFLDTVRYTQLGPVMYDASFGKVNQPLAARWVAHEPSLELLAFYQLNRAHSFETYKNALTHYAAPAQNFVFSSQTGDIAIRQQGKFVNRWEGQGLFILSSADSSHQWQSFLPPDQVPQVLNPERGFVSSANQRATDHSYPYPYHGKFQKFRNRRLNTLLAQEEKMDMEGMKAIQLDNYSLIAAEALPMLLGDIDKQTLSDRERDVYELLESWDYLYEAESVAPTIFQKWWDTLYVSIWQDEFLREGLDTQWPETYRTIELLRAYPYFSFFDDINTAKIENRRTLVNQSFRITLKDLYARNPNPETWTWGEEKKTSIRHMARLSPSLGRHNLMADGNREILNATSRHHGPSWRMVVSLEDPIKAEGIYPGGQSGNPGSPLYDNMVDDWVDGNYYSLHLQTEWKPDAKATLYQVKITN